MNKFLKVILAGAALFLLLIVIAVYLLFSNLDKIVAEIIEEAGTEVTKTEVTVDSVSLELTEGKAAINGLTVASPPGSAQPHMFKLGMISVDLDPEATAKADRVIYVDEIVIKKPFVAYEIDEKGRSSLDDLQKKTKGKKKSATDEGAGKDEEPQTGTGPDEPRLVIRRLLVEDGEISVIAPPDTSKPQLTKLPRIELTDIGADKGGATPGEVAQLIVGTIVSEATNAAFKAQLKKKMGEEMDKAKEKLDEKLKEEGVSEEAGKAIKGLFGD